MVRTLCIVSRIPGVGGLVLAALFFASTIHPGMTSAGTATGVGIGPGGLAAGGAAVALGVCLIPMILLYNRADRVGERQMGERLAARDRIAGEGARG